ncbi:MAG: DUF711 family protein [Anaerolineales bacterium]
MRIRSITVFLHPRWPINELLLRKAGIFAQNASHAYQSAGFTVQSIRLATPPFGQFLPLNNDHAAFTQIEILAHSEGFDYVSLGPALPDHPETYHAIPYMLANSGNLFFSGHLTTTNKEISLTATRACADVIHRAASIEAQGFANLRFAALANVPPWGPFFPAAYHQGKSTVFALALETADLALQAFSEADLLAEARGKLITAIENHANKLEEISRELEKTYNIEFKGMDFSTAPFPTQDISVGAALEKLGLPAFGLSGSLASAAFLMDALDKAYFMRTGFNGLMLPLLEDARLAQRGAKGTLNITDLLLYSAVCGTGLDTLPIPGDATPDQIQAVLLDIAALALRLDKPLTARLMPIPGRKAGEETGFDFEYFANSKVLSLPAEPLSRFWIGDEDVPIQPKN